jgi:murein DD-endopeptidase MepM/ murein hydrolase activator NlpD
MGGMKTIAQLATASTLLPLLLHGADMMTPAYYTGEITSEADVFLSACRKVQMRHPLENRSGKTPDHTIPGWGNFGAGKGPTRTEQHHPAVDLHVGNRQTEVELFAAHDGVVAIVRDAPKYRHYISITKSITNETGKVLGKLVTLYGHVDLDLDAADGLKKDGQLVKAGDLISRNLYADTRGGPHLHFEIRYYRPSDSGTEEFYGFRQAMPGAGDWPHGRWNPECGYGYGHPESHGLHLAEAKPGHAHHP